MRWSFPASLPLRLAVATRLCEVAYSLGLDTELCVLHSLVFFDYTSKPPAWPGLLSLEVDGVRYLATFLYRDFDDDRSSVIIFVDFLSNRTAVLFLFYFIWYLVLAEKN